jgi:uncharacterized protein YoaH (UPF0181 family)
MTNLTLDIVKQLPISKQQEVEDFINFLASKYLSSGENIDSLAESRRKNLGRYKGQIYMSDDFNLTPSDFDEYL